MSLRKVTVPGLHLLFWCTRKMAHDISAWTTENWQSKIPTPFQESTTHWMLCWALPDSPQLTCNMAIGKLSCMSKTMKKTAFTTVTGLYHFKVMSVGITNAPATCQRLTMLRGLPWKTCLVYLDDVLIYRRSFSEHLQLLEEILSRFPESLKMLFWDQEQFLGHVVSKDGIQPDPWNVKSVQDWPIPQSATEVRALLGLCSYYSKFIRSFAHHST